MTAIYPPIAKRIPKKKRLHGCTLSDDYAWLQNKGTKRVTEYLLAENKYTSQMMAPSEALQKNFIESFLRELKRRTRMSLIDTGAINIILERLKEKTIQFTAAKA